MVKGEKISALYFPYADLIQSQKILLAALYFDCIYILEPNFFRPPCQRAGQDIPSSMDIIDLIHAGIVKPIGPELIGMGKNFGLSKQILDEENMEGILASIQLDLKDQTLYELVSKYPYTYWQIPTGQQLFWNGLGILLEASNSLSSIQLEIQTERPEYYQQLLTINKYTKAQIVEDSLSRIRGKNNELLVKVPFLEAESLMINVALLACSELGLCPITDSQIHHKFLLQKLSNPKLQDALKQTHFNTSSAIKEAQLYFNSIQIYLPQPTNLTAEKIINIRYKCRDSLDRFHIYMGKLKHSIESEVWSSDFENEINKTIDKEIKPACMELQEALKFNAKELGIQIVDDITKLAPVPLITTLSTGLPLEWVLSASAGTIALKDLLAYKLQKGKLKTNGVFFLLESSKF